MERPYYSYEGNIRKTNRLFRISAALILTGAAALGLGFYKSIQDVDNYEHQKTEIGNDISLSQEEKAERISQLSSRNDENQAIGAGGLFSLTVGVGFLGAAAVEASQEHR